MLHGSDGGAGVSSTAGHHFYHASEKHEQFGIQNAPSRCCDHRERGGCATFELIGKRHTFRSLLVLGLSHRLMDQMPGKRANRTCGIRREATMQTSGDAISQKSAVYRERSLADGLGAAP